MNSEKWGMMSDRTNCDPPPPHNFFHSPFLRINSKLKLLPIYIKLYLHFLENNLSDMMQISISKIKEASSKKRILIQIYVKG
jgi:hypothetical protein